MPLPAPAYVSGNWQVPTPIEVPRFSNGGIQRVNQPLVLTLRYKMYAALFDVTPLNTLFSDTASNALAVAAFDTLFTNQGLSMDSFYLVDESERTTDGVTCEWTRTYARVPDSYRDTEDVQYPFIAFYPGITVILDGISQGRSTQQTTTSGIVVYDFELVPDPDLIDSILPILPAQFYGYQTTGNTPTYEPFTEVSMLQAEGTVSVDFNTYPTLEEYKNWIAVCATVQSGGVDPGTGRNPQTQDQPFPLNFMIRPINSQRYHWLGNIWARKTIYINPQ